jgi:TolB-like protein
MSGDSLGIGDATQSNVPLTADHPPLSRDVFVSYASQDAAVANKVVEALEKHGIQCWIAPRDVVPGSLYADEIVGAINDAKVVVLVLSEHSITSPHVGKEIERASSKRRRIIALHVDSAPLTRAFEYFLSESQWIDVGAGAVEAAAAKLVEAVRRHLDPAGAVEPRGRSDQPTVRPGSTPRRRWMVAGGAILLVTLAYFAVDKFRISRRVVEEKPVAAPVPATVTVSRAIPEKSVAVLPFVDMSEKKDQEYFSDGLSEELIDRLTKIPDLRVPARTSSFYFKGKQATIADIAKALSVSHVLEGSVRKSGKSLRITAQLIRVDNGYHLWSETYDKKLDDIFKMQDEIAAAVVKALKVSLLEGAVPQSQPSTDAYALYLQGRAMIRRASTQAEWEKAVDYFQKAVSVDPRFATAWAWLAHARCDQVVWGVVDQQVVSIEAHRAADRAFALNPNLADAHAAMGRIHYNFDWNWEAAAAEFKKAHELDPADAGSAKVLADVLFQLGSDDKTIISLYQHAIDLDPVNDRYFFTLGFYDLYMSRLPEAEASVRKALDLNPTHWEYHAGLGGILLARGDLKQALAEFQREPDESARRQGAALAYHALGRKEEADAALTEAERKDAAIGAYGIAEIYAYRGEINQAFAWLDRAYRQRDAGLPSTNRDPLLKNLRPDPRYTAFLRKMKLPE